MVRDKLFHKKKKGRLERKTRKLKEYKDSILIVCEGEKTEPHYFEGFPISNIKVKTIGTGRNTESLVVEAIRKWTEFANEYEYYEKLWCVFDRDSFDPSTYEGAFNTVAHENKRLNKKYQKKVGREITISIAYTNEAFELWYLLHFDYIETPLIRSQYETMLTKRMGKKYEKNDPSMYQFFEKLAKRTNNKQGQNFAIRNAKKLRERIGGKLPRNVNPSTQVDKLVMELNEHLKK